MTESESDTRILFFLDHPREMGFAAYFDGNFISGNIKSKYPNKNEKEKIKL